MAKAKARDTEYEQIAQDSAELRPLGFPQAQLAPEDVLSEIARPLRETLPEVDRRIFGLVETARRVQDPTRLRAFLTRSLLRVVDLAATDPRYGPHVRWCVELGVSAILLPAEHRTDLGRAAWAVMVHCLQKLSPDVETPAQRLADRTAIVATVLALSLSTEELEQSNRWVEDAAFQCFLLVSDASAPTCAGRDEDLLGDSFTRDLEALVGLPAIARAISPWEDGPLGKFWPNGVPSGLSEPCLAELRRWADQLTGCAEKPNLGDVEPLEAREARRGDDRDEIAEEPVRNPLDTSVTPEEPGEEQQRVRLRSPHALQELRERMREAVEQSNLKLDEIGVRMGIEPDKHPKAAVNKLMRRSPDPGLFMLLRFCKAVGVPLSQLVPDSVDPSR